MEIPQRAQEQAILSKAYDRASGNLFLGLNTGNGDKSVVKIPRYNGVGKIKTTAIGASVTNEAVEFLTLATYEENCSCRESSCRCCYNCATCIIDPLLGLVTQAEQAGELISASQTHIHAMTNKGTKDTESSALIDARGRNNVTSGIVAVAGQLNAPIPPKERKKSVIQEGFLFAAVRPAGDSNNNFGNDYSGVAAVKIIRKRASTELIQINANNGSETNPQAKRVDRTTTELAIGGGPIELIETNTASLYWDNRLERLYIGINRLGSSSSSADQGAKSVIVGRMEPFPNTEDLYLAFSSIAVDNAFTTSADNEIVGIKGLEESLIGVHNIRVMHTSTGKHYLIVNGGNELQPNQNLIPGNRIYALPLVYDPSNPDIHGTLANKHDPTFTQPATTPGQLVHSDELNAIVGLAPAPIKDTDVINDMFVVGDAVFISVTKTATTQPEENESGILFSQAMFDKFGAIYRWTKWTKKAFPVNFLSEIETTTSGEFIETSTTTEPINLFAVDAANGKIWAISKGDTGVVSTPIWLDENGETSLVTNLNKDLADGCYSVLDLDQSTKGLGSQSPGRYALFGGISKVIFARISLSTTTTAPFDIIDPTTERQRPQTKIADFSAPQNYLVTHLDDPVGCIKQLEYSRRLTSTAQEQQTFLAGGPSGLYAYLSTDSIPQGFIADANLNNLNQFPFSEFTWKKVYGIKGSVIDIKSTGDAFYVLTQQMSYKNSLKSVLYSIPFTSTHMGEIVSESNISIIAVSSTFIPNADLKKAKIFFGIQVITRDEGQIKELLLATNHGIYTSDTETGIDTTRDQQEAGWKPVDTSDSSMYNTLFGIDTDTPSTVWPIRVADQQYCKTFIKSQVAQLNGSAQEDNLPTFNPINSNAAKTDDYTIDQAFKFFEPITHFYSDGARRFFAINSPDCYYCTRNRLFVIPFDIVEWNIKKPTTQVLIERVLKQQKQFFWTKTIGASGLLMAGTEKGVVALDINSRYSTIELAEEDNDNNRSDLFFQP